MNTYKIYTVEGRTLRFRGDLIAAVKSGLIETTQGGLWFALNAYDREPAHFVVSISANRNDSEIDEVFEFYSTANVTAAEDFLYDFDPSVILPKDILMETQPQHKSAIVTADHVYYAAARRLIRELYDHAARQQVFREKTEQTSQAVSELDASVPKGKLVNRIRHLFGI